MKSKLLLASELTACLPKIRTELDVFTPGARLLFIPTAAIGEGWTPEYDSHVRPFEEMGFTVDWFDLEGKAKEETATKLRENDVVYVSGGNTFHLLEHSQRSGFHDLVGRRIADGMIYVGSSAGSILATPDIGYAASVDDRSKAVLENDEGLGLVDFSILPHMDHPAFSAAVGKLYREMSGGSRMCIGLNDNQMVVVEGRAFRIV